MSINIEIGTVLCDQNGTYQILKRISDGYLALHYEDAHYVYHVLYKTFDEVDSMTECNDWDRCLFDADNIAHIDEFGFCKNIS